MKAIATLIALTVAFVCGVIFSSENNEASNSTRHFIGLGDLPGGIVHSIAKSVSADGSVVVGYSCSEAGLEAFRWTRDDGLTGLAFAAAASVAADGRTIVGYRDTRHRIESVRWTEAGGIESLDPQANYQSSAAHSVSTNGAVVVGVAEEERSSRDGRDVAFRWTLHDELTLLKNCDDQSSSEAYGVSADGNVAFGACRSATGHYEACLWSREAGSILLGFLPGHTTSVAYGASSDGVVVVGCSSDFISTKAFRWTQETGMASLGSLPGSSGDSAAYSCSSDGSVVVGYCNDEVSSSAIVWDAPHGMRSIRALLTRDARLVPTLRDWKLRSALAVSADGSTIVGYGINPDGNHEAWLAYHVLDL